MLSTRQDLRLRETSEDLQPLPVADFAEEFAQRATKERMDEVRVYLEARDEGKPPLVKPGMGYDKLRCIEDEVIEEEDIEVQGPGPEEDVTRPRALLLDG